MVSSGGNPFPWTIAVGFALGLALFIAIRPGKRRDSGGNPGERFVPVMLVLSAAVLVAAAGALACGKRAIDLRAAWSVIAFAFLSCLALRFPRAVGVPVGAVIILMAGLGTLLSADWRAVPDDGAIVGLSVFEGGEPSSGTSTGKGVSVEFALVGIGSFSATLPGVGFEVEVQTVRFSPPLDFAFPREYYRVTGYLSEKRFVAFRPQPAVSLRFWKYGAPAPHAIPGMAFGSSRIKAEFLRFLGRYRVTIGNDGGLALIELK